MKFAIRVDPRAAIQSKNESFGEQIVDVPIDSFSDDERSVIAHCRIDDKKCVHLQPGWPGDAQSPEQRVVGELRFERADEAAVRKMLGILVAPIVQRRETEESVRANFDSLLRRNIDKAEGHYDDYKLNRLFAVNWISTNFGVDSEIAQTASAYAGAWSGRRLIDMTEVRKDLWWLVDDDWISLSDTYEQQYFRKEFKEWVRVGNNHGQVIEMLAKRAEILEAAFETKLEEARSKIGEAVRTAQDEQFASEFEDAFIENVLRDRDRETADLSLMERYHDGVLPDSELKDVLRHALFSGLDAFRRYERIDARELKAKHREKVEFKTRKAETINAKTFALAKKIRTIAPGANVEVIVHVASEGTKLLEERQAVHVGIRFRGTLLTREYVAD